MLVEPLYGKDGPFRETSAREESKAAPEAAAKAPAASAPARGIGVGSRVQDSEGTCGEIVEANNAWLTMRTDAGEERKVRKFTLKLISGAVPVPDKRMVRVKLEDAAEPPGIGVGSRVQDSEGICGEIVARSGAWLTMRTDAGEERKMRKADLELITPGAPTVAPTSAGDAGGAQAAASDRKQGARGASQKARKRGRAAVESTDESASPSDQSEAGELPTSRV